MCSFPSLLNLGTNGALTAVSRSLVKLEEIISRQEQTISRQEQTISLQASTIEKSRALDEMKTKVVDQITEWARRVEQENFHKAKQIEGLKLRIKGLEEARARGGESGSEGEGQEQVRCDGQQFYRAATTMARRRDAERRGVDGSLTYLIKQ